ncbi:MAG: hypothetical protein ACRD0U_00975, partial [Acidimicrobiales bacterium]
VHACAQPVLSRRVLLPVNSAPERETAELLLRQVKYWARPASRLAIDVEVEKPVFDEATPSGGCRPNFTLWLPDARRVIVQVARTDQPRSAAEHPLHARVSRLPGVAAVVQHRAGRDNQERFARKLTGIMHAVINELEPGCGAEP